MTQTLHATNDALLKFEESLTLHISLVERAGKTIGVPVSQLMAHDLSKWEKDEFDAYAMHFHGGLDKSVTQDVFDYAWLHHIHHNPHHWEHWVIAKYKTLEMPKEFALEMIADWMGASMAYTNSWDMTEWLKGNWSRINLHVSTRDYVSSVLLDMGYTVRELIGGTDGK